MPTVCQQINAGVIFNQPASVKYAARQAGGAVRNRAIPLVMAALVACGGPAKNVTEQGPQEPTAAPGERILVAPELGKIPPGKPMTKDNMPLFDTVTYCVAKTEKTDTFVKGPQYEQCVEDQDHLRIIVGEAIDKGQFKAADVIRCAKLSPTAYQGEWYCLNRQSF